MDSIDSILEFACSLIRIPSQGGIDNPQPVLHEVENWFADRSLPGSLLTGGDGRPLAFYGEIAPRDADLDLPLYVLDACIDTAAAGDRASWSCDPFGAVIEGPWLYGRGSGDSKIAVSIFSHLFAYACRHRASLRGRLGVLFDADEHTGSFGGVRRLVEEFSEKKKHISGVSIGYPGTEEIVIGARGFYRAELEVPGTAAHTGLPEMGKDNAARKGAELVSGLYRSWECIEKGNDENFPFGPSFTVTEIHGGSAFSVVPDLCTIRIDMRLTAEFARKHARAFLEKSVESLQRDVVIRKLESWPAYTLPPEARLPAALGEAAHEVLEQEVPWIFCGPSNIGNYLASFGIPATCGFGVLCENFHAADERIRIDTVPAAYSVYLRMMGKLIGLGIE